MKRIFCILIIMAAFLPQASAQKQYKTIRTLMKAKNYSGILTQVNECLKDSALRENPKTYEYASYANLKNYIPFNMKAYLKQPLDTAGMYNTTYAIFENMLKWDDKECVPDKKGRVKPKNRKKIYRELKELYPNLFTAGLFYIKKKNYAEADKFFSMYLNTASHPVFVADSLLKREPKMIRASFWSMTCNFLLNKYQDVFRFEKLAAADTANTDVMLQYKALSYVALKNNAGYEQTLREGVEKVPQNLFYFSRLTDYYNESKKYDAALSLCDSLIKARPDRTIYHFGRCIVLFNQKRYEECHASSSELLAQDSSYVDLYYYISSCTYNLTAEAEDRINTNMSEAEYKAAKAKAIEGYKQALPYMEIYRQKCPDRHERWAQPLYRMYLALNMGKEFEEIDKFLQQKDAQQQEAAKAAAADAAKKKK